eukprot:1153509-Pelagomonas_calceolata.AAC.2
MHGPRRVSLPPSPPHPRSSAGAAPQSVPHCSGSSGEDGAARQRVVGGLHVVEPAREATKDLDLCVRSARGCIQRVRGGLRIAESACKGATDLLTCVYCGGVLWCEGLYIITGEGRKKLVWLVGASKASKYHTGAHPSEPMQCPWGPPPSATH